MLTLSLLLASTMPRKVVSGPDYDDDEYDYEDYEDDYDDYEEAEHVDVKPPVKEKGTCACVQAAKTVYGIVSHDISSEHKEFYLLSGCNVRPDQLGSCCIIGCFANFTCYRCVFVMLMLHIGFHYDCYRIL
jgi:hypothetical protein